MTIPQTSQFVPLTAAATATDKRDFQITVIPQNEQPPGFQSLDKVMPAAGERSAFKKNCEPHLTVQREGERITNIRIQCSCGQMIDLACVYDATPKPT
jgi:hypothetical protein